uniref:Receptor ligand binding region domain-containing protein n=1 Tax=Plectus sambesii TaxID=2011161 RepID=A0A914V2J3_9BILA
MFCLGSVANEESIERRSLSFAVKQWNDARTQETTIRFKVVNSGSKAHDIEERVCDILQRKPVAIIVPSTSKYAANYVRRACEQFRIPCVDIDGSNDLSDFGVNVGIPREAAGRALAAFVTKLQWANFVLFYQRSSDLAELGPLLELTSSWPHPGIVLRQLPKNNDLRAFLKHIRNSVHATRMVIHTKDISDTYRFLQHARIMRMTDAKYSYAVTNMDLSLLEEYVLNSTDFTCNITGLRLINNDSFQRKVIDSDAPTIMLSLSSSANC